MLTNSGKIHVAYMWKSDKSCLRWLFSDELLYSKKLFFIHPLWMMANSSIINILLNRVADIYIKLKSISNWRWFIRPKSFLYSKVFFIHPLWMMVYFSIINILLKRVINVYNKLKSINNWWWFISPKSFLYRKKLFFIHPLWMMVNLSIINILPNRVPIFMTNWKVLVTDDGLYNRKAFYTLKFFLFILYKAQYVLVLWVLLNLFAILS